MCNDLGRLHAHSSALAHSRTLALSLAAAACGDKAKPAVTTAAAAPEASLYDRLGRRDNIAALVEDFAVNVGRDEKINQFFKNSDLKSIKEKFTDQICEVTGGPCKYTGVHKDMKTAHLGMKITEDDFNALIANLVKTLDKFGVGERERTELLGALGGMKGEIVGP